MKISRKKIMQALIYKQLAGINIYTTVNEHEHETTVRVAFIPECDYQDEVLCHIIPIDARDMDSQYVASSVFIKTAQVPYHWLDKFESHWITMIPHYDSGGSVDAADPVERTSKETLESLLARALCSQYQILVYEAQRILFHGDPMDDLPF